MASRSTDPLRSTNETRSAEPVTSNSTSHSAAHVNSRKRFRQSPHADEIADMDYVDLSGGSRMRKSKKVNVSQPATPTQPYSYSDTLAGPSSSFLPKTNVQISTLITDSQAELPLINLASLDAAPISNRGEGFAGDLQEELYKVRRELEQLKQQHQSQSKNQEAAKLQTVQQMMLDRLHEQKEHKYQLETLRKQKSFAVQYAKEQSSECEKHRKKIEESTKKCAKLLGDMNFLKDDVEHLQALNRVMEEDLDELRRIDNEDRAWRRQNKRDLPPAYGSLDGDIDSGEIRLHQDSGSFDIASLKRTLNKDLSATIQNAQLTADMTRPSDASGSDTVVFFQTSLALADASRVLKAALDRAENLEVTTIRLAAAASVAESSYMTGQSDVGRYVIARRAARRQFAADRMAKILVSLVWRVVSATEFRPVTLNFQPREKTMLCLAYKEVDDTFHEALRQAFIHGESEPPVVGRLHEYQNYLSQLTALRSSFDGLRAGLSYSPFKKSWEWLSEEVELERMKRANQEPSPGDCPFDNAAQGLEPGSEVSSEQAPTESSITESDASL